MKKILCLVLALMLLSCAALAESEKEITFQGVKWGSSIEEMGKIWVSNGFVFEHFSPEPEWVSHMSTEYLTNENTIDVSMTADGYEAVGGRAWHGWTWFDGAKIAGYDIREIQTFWACDEDDSALLAVKVILKVNDKAAAYDDLVAKLTSLYGEGQNVKHYAQVNAWLGANNTAVLITADGHNTASELLTERSGDRLALIYGTLDAQNILEAYYAEYLASYKPEPTVNPGDVSGL